MSKIKNFFNQLSFNVYKFIYNQSVFIWNIFSNKLSPWWWFVNLKCWQSLPNHPKNDPKTKRIVKDILITNGFEPKEENLHFLDEE